jgi:tripartite-type tricarboxylate transporter receptor subunit TctC
MIKSALNLNTVDVPYAGSPPVIVAVLGKHVQLGSAAFSAAAPKIKDGSLRALATSAVDRLPLLPEVPTLNEKGVRQAHLVLAHGLYAPKGTPAPIVRALANALQEAIKDPNIAGGLQKVGLTVRYDDTQKVRDQLENENRVVSEFGLKPK